MSKQKIIIIAVIIAVLVGAVAYLNVNRKPSPVDSQPPRAKTEISWEECTKLPGSAISQTYPEQCVAADGRRAVNPASTSALKNPIVSINLQRVSSSPVLGGKPGIEVAVWVSDGFPVRNEIPVLRIGRKEFILSRYPESGDTHELIFTLTSKEFAGTKTGDPVSVYYGRGGGSGKQWNFGPLDKAKFLTPTAASRGAQHDIRPYG